MKKLLICALFCISLFSACGLNAQHNQKKPAQLTYDAFIRDIWDFEKNANTFIYKGDVPAVIDFYADWCGPCRKIAPIMEKLSKEYDGKIKVYKVNVDQQKKLAGSFNVSSIPAVLFIPMKGNPMMQVGALSEQQYKQIIEKDLLDK